MLTKGIVFAYELHPGSDVYDGATYEMFLDYTDNHPAACMNYDASQSIVKPPISITRERPPLISVCC